MTRVAAVQFASGTEVKENLATCLRMIDQAALHKPDLMVLPEFCNHISWYDDADHAREVSLDLDGFFLAQVSARAGRHGCYIVINVTLRRAGGELSITSLMYGPDGDLLAQADKQTLMGHENFWFQRATSVGDVVDSAFGRLGMFPCRDGVTFETPRCLALRGVQLFCDSLNSFALDEASLHVPARAPENGCFLVAANKVGPLIPQDLLQQVSDEAHIPIEFLSGAGESQIVAPSGDVLVRAPRDEESVIWADVDLQDAVDKRDMDGTDRFANRRPRLYSAISRPTPEAARIVEATCVSVACICPTNGGAAGLTELVAQLGELPLETRLAVLPELSGVPWTQDRVVLEQADQLIEQLVSVCCDRPKLSICSSLPVAMEGGIGHAVLLIDERGVVARQDQLHLCDRLPGMRTGETFNTIEMPWGRLALMTAEDMRHPEMTKLAAIDGAQLIAVPGRLLEQWDSELALPSRAAENRVCIAYASQPLNGSGSLLADLQEDFTLMTEWQHREFDGYINQPLVTRQAEGEQLLSGNLNLPAANNKLMSAQTDLIGDRPWRLSTGLTEGLDHG